MGLHTIPLYWKNFHSNLFATLTDLHTQNIFTDVTLVSDDGIMFAAHKSLLSSSSPVLKTLFLNHPDTNPIIFMEDVHEEQLRAILQFIYLGEVRVLTSGIGLFLEIAKELQITEIIVMNQSAGENKYGITDKNASEITNEIADKIRDENKHVNYTPEVMLKEECDILEQVEMEELNNGVPEKANNGSSEGFSSKSSSHICSICDSVFKTKTKLKCHYNSIHMGIKYPCNVCDHKSTDPSNLKKHHQVEHEGYRHTCNTCEFEAKSQKSLKDHCLRKHKGITFSCGKCDHQSITLSNLEYHKKLKHKEPNTCEYCESVFKTNQKLHIFLRFM